MVSLRQLSWILHEFKSLYPYLLVCVNFGLTY